MNGEWCYFKNRLTKEVCDYIIQEGLKLPKEDAKIGVAGAMKVEETRKSKISFSCSNLLCPLPQFSQNSDAE